MRFRLTENCDASAACRFFDYIFDTHQYASNEVLIDHRTVSEPPSPTPLIHQIRGAVSHNFCNFSKQTIRQARPLYVAIFQVCRADKVFEVELLSQAAFFHSQKYFRHFLYVVQCPCKPLRRDCLKVCGFIPICTIFVSCPSPPRRQFV